jgi:peptide/nickel transport system ATP-binding protein
MPSIPVTAEAAHQAGAGAPVLELEHLSVAFATPDGEVRAVSELSLTIGAGECIGVVGESGAGKSQAFLAAMGLLASNGRIGGKARFTGVDLLQKQGPELDSIRGASLSMIFQDPMTSLTPHMRVGDQIAESIVRHRGVSWAAGRKRALELLRLVHVTDAERRLWQYPHELSGGMRQRVMIAVALACDPALVIADEPTTALDVTIQAQILDLLEEMKERLGMAVLLITHAMGVVAEVAQRVIVMYAGKVVEEAPVGELFANPRHPYTQGLIRSIPRLDLAATEHRRLEAIPGTVPSLLNPPEGCRFAARCRFATDACRAAEPPLREVVPGHKVACIL